MDPNFILNLSPDERAAVAKHMVAPSRCGGLSYDENGKPFYQIGKRRLSPEEFGLFCNRLSEGTDG